MQPGERAVTHSLTHSLLHIAFLSSCTHPPPSQEKVLRMWERQCEWVTTSMMSLVNNQVVETFLKMARFNAKWEWSLPAHTIESRSVSSISVFLHPQERNFADMKAAGRMGDQNIPGHAATFRCRVNASLLESKWPGLMSSENGHSCTLQRLQSVPAFIHLPGHCLHPQGEILRMWRRQGEWVTTILFLVT